MSYSKRLSIEIGSLFIVIMFSQWIVSLGEDGKPFMEEPLRCLIIVFLVSILGGYFMNWFKLKTEEKERQKAK